MKALITGAAGFIGGHLAAELLGIGDAFEFVPKGVHGTLAVGVGL